LKPWVKNGFMNRVYSAVFLTGALGLLIALGVGLFFVRDRKMPLPIPHEISLHAKKSTERIVAGKFLILVKPNHVDKLNEILAPLSLELKLPILNWLLVGKKNHEQDQLVPLESELASESSLLLSSLLQHPYVLDAQYDYVLDPNISAAHDWQLNASSLTMPAAMNLPMAWAITTGSDKTAIAVVDQFLFDGHFTFRDRFLACLNRVSLLTPHLGTANMEADTATPHGEIMLQALGACNNHEPYSTGIDSHAQILATHRASLGHGETFAAALIASQIDICAQSLLPCPPEIKYSLPHKKPDVLLLPFGDDAPELLQFTTDMISAIRLHDITVVTAAGNNAANAQNYFPGGSPYVINVGAINEDGIKSGFSNWGPAVDILAPGHHIEFSYPNGPKSVSGTSLSASFVAGAVSLMKAVNPALSHKALEFLLRDSARPLTCDQYCEKNKDCQSLCCGNDVTSCGKLALDIGQAVKRASTKAKLPPLLDLNYQYLLFLRNEATQKTVTVKNLGDMPTKVLAQAFASNVMVTPSEFSLGTANSLHDRQDVVISLKREPFKRETYKVEFAAKNNGRIVDRTELYLEYIPKK